MSGSCKKLNAISIQLCFLWLLFIGLKGNTQQVNGQVADSSGKLLAFATIKFGNSGQGTIADLQGKFSFYKKNEIRFIEVSYLNYKTKIINITKPADSLYIILEAIPASYSVVVVSKVGSKVKRIINTAIANRDQHNPDKYPWYQCNMYYKMVADFLDHDSLLQKDTSRSAIAMQRMMNEQNVLVSETYSKRTWQRPARLQEDVIASRLSGFKRAPVSLVTNVLPFHCYNDYINLNEREYRNPLSRGSFQTFNFKIEDEILQGSDTVWVINYVPKNNPSELRGSLFIHSDGYAISNLVAKSIDTLINREIAIEQQYRKDSSHWFPHQLNYTIRMQMPMMPASIYMTGTSRIDSVRFTANNNFKFDKAHTIRLAVDAEKSNDSSWQRLRPTPLEKKEQRTFAVMDSISQKKGVSKVLAMGEKLVDGKIPYKVFDINLERLFTYNHYEKSRFGFGMQTNEKVSKWFSIGGWGGYGIADKQWKYGAFGEVYLDRYKEFIVRASYYTDIRDPGRLQINKDLDKNYLRTFLLSRVDRVNGFTFSIKKKLGYLSAEILGTKENLQPQYAYAYTNRNKTISSFDIREATLNLRYAYGETTTPVFGKYYATQTKYPVLYARFTNGIVQNASISYWQALVAVNWQKRINRIGKEKILVMAATTISNDALPLGKTFAGNGFRDDERSIYVFGGMQTMRPYDYYMDRFINVHWVHEVNAPVYRAKLYKNILTSVLTPGVGHNILYGTMDDRHVHQNVTFTVPDNAYHETGIFLNNILRLKVLNSFYASLNTAYFYHWTPTAMSSNGKFAFGITSEF